MKKHMNHRPPLYRRQFIVDRKLQFSLILYSVAMAASGVTLAGAIFAVGMTSSDFAVGLSGAQITILFCAAFGFISTIILVVLVSNHVAGPLHRMRQSMRDIAAGAPPQKLTPRKGDLMENIFHDYNSLLERIASDNKK